MQRHACILRAQVLLQRLISVRQLIGVGAGDAHRCPHEGLGSQASMNRNPSCASGNSVDPHFAGLQVAAWKSVLESLQADDGPDRVVT